MTLSSASTLAEVEAAYDDNANYRDDSSVAKARLFAHACRLLVRRYLSSVGNDGTSVSRNVDLIKEQLKEVDAWLDSNDTARTDGGSTVLDFREARQ